MKYNTCLVVWHNKEPVYSIDFHPGSDRFATAGADKTVKIWKWNGDGSFAVEFVSTLQRHNAAVNIVRFSPNGETLASGGDDGMVFLWKLNPTPSVAPTAVGISDEDESLLNKETWTIANTLICGKEIYSLDWSPDSTAIITGSIDTTVTVWNLLGAGGPRRVQEIRDHTHYVQGVGWDPRNKFLITQSIDRTVRVYRMQRKARKGAGSAAASYVCGAVIKKRTGEGFAIRKEKKTGTSKQEEQLPEISAPVIDADEGPVAVEASNVPAAVPTPEEPFVHKMFLDESVSSFFRRICWSPCGNLFFAPTGTFMKNSTAEPVDCTYVFSRDNMRTPICYIPSPSKPSIIIRCNPVLFRSREVGSSATLLDLTYRIVFAIATIDSVLVYDSQHTSPLLLLKDIHYASISDLSWSLDGYRLGISSTDGFCSFVQFDRDDLGDPLEGPELEEAMQKVIEARLGSSNKSGDGAEDGNGSFEFVNKSADDLDEPDGDGVMNVMGELSGDRGAKRKESDDLFVMPPAKIAKTSEFPATDVPLGTETLSSFDSSPAIVVPTAPRPKAKRVTPQVLTSPSANQPN